MRLWRGTVGREGGASDVQVVELASLPGSVEADDHDDRPRGEQGDQRAGPAEPFIARDREQCGVDEGANERRRKHRETCSDAEQCAEYDQLVHDPPKQDGGVLEVNCHGTSLCRGVRMRRFFIARIRGAVNDLRRAKRYYVR